METIASRYRLEEKIGTGGEARVFRARDLLTGGDVAVRLSPRNDSAATEREIPAGHCGWVRLLDRGVDPAQGAYAVFELLHGETLGAMTAREPLAHEAWLDFARQSLDAVGALHREGWIHGDVNADNFFLDGGTTWKLLELPFYHAVPVEQRSPLFGSIYFPASRARWIMRLLERDPGDRPDDVYAARQLLDSR
jgi:serine/threonine protein kinase